MNLHAKHLPADARRAATVEAVVALAADRNPDLITTAAIARQMDVTQGALFRHFPNKEAIWEAVMGWVAEHLLARVERAVAGKRSPLAALEAAFLTHVDFVVQHAGVPRMLFGELQRAEDTAAKRMARTLIERYARRLGGLIEAGKAAGEVDARVDGAAAAMLFIGSIQGLVMQSLLVGEIQRMRQAAPGVFAIYRRGIARDPSVTEESIV
jgi:TetR/AcrR family transcriptional regulator